MSEATCWGSVGRVGISDGQKSLEFFSRRRGSSRRLRRLEMDRVLEWEGGVERKHVLRLEVALSCGTIGNGDCPCKLLACLLAVRLLRMLLRLLRIITPYLSLVLLELESSSRQVYGV